MSAQEPAGAAAERTRGFGAALTRPIVVLLALQLMGGMLLMPQRTFFPLYASALGYSAARISALTTVRMFLAMLASLIGGTLCDTLGRKRTLLLGNLGFVVGGLLFLTPNPWWIAILWSLSGFGSGLHTLGGQSYLIDAARSAYLGVLTALFNWGYTLGGALASPIAGYLIDQWNYRAYGGALTLFALATVAINVTLLPRVAAPGEGIARRRAGLMGYGDVARRREVVLLVCMRFLPTVYWGTASAFVPLLLDAAGATVPVIALYATVSQVVASLAQIVVGRAADRYGPRGVTLATFCALTASVTVTATFASNLWVAFVSGTLSAAAAWSLSTLLPSWVSLVTLPEERGRTLGWIHLWWNAAMMGGSVLGGALFEQGAGLPFLVAALLSLAAIGVTVVFFRTARQLQATGAGVT
ncbi:MAG: MFS transporter [Anaerolineae bacterium]|nr:MFS transporter [Anaerolineae bacterium]